MKILPAFFQLDQFDISAADVTQTAFHCDPDAIHPDVILMPSWQPGVLGLWTEPIKTITENILFEIVYNGKPISIVRSGIGAPQAGDVTLALGCTACERILFTGSIGGLRTDMNIGDLVLPEFSYCGDGFCRYLEPGFPMQDCFLERSVPDEALAQTVARSTVRFAWEADVPVYSGPVFCTDSILSQFSRLDTLVNELGCIGIEMETAAVFKAARMVGIQAAALFSVSDVPLRNKTLFFRKIR